MRAFIIMRDRVTYARQVAEKLWDAGLDVVIADHGTTWEPALEWLDMLERNGIEVMRRGPGMHPRSLWDDDRFKELCGDERYIVTDPDTPPAPECPQDWLPHLGEVLDSHSFGKVGMALRIDDLPDHYSRKQQVIGWESRYWHIPLTDGVYFAGVDTTLALYVPLTVAPFHNVDPAIRTGKPYEALHLPWYEDLGNLTPEMQYYHDHAESGISFWTVQGRSAGPWEG